MIAQINEIPRLPQVSMEVIQQAFSDEPDIHKVATIIERDPTLTAKLFKTVNSAGFGLKVQVTSIQQTISIIGLDALRSIVVTLALGEYFDQDSFGKALDIKSFCTHSLATAVIMKGVATTLNFKHVDQLYLIGLLHDLGKVALDCIPNSDYTEVLKRVEEGATFEEAEREVYSVDNREVWRLLARTWSFPEEIIELYSGDMEGDISLPTLNLIDDASELADRLGFRFTNPPLRDEPDESSLLASVDREKVVEIGQTVQKQIEIMGQVLDLPVPDCTTIQDTLLRTSHQLSVINTKYIKKSEELGLRVKILEELTSVFTGIIKSLDSDSLAFSVLESLMEGFHVDAVFLLLNGPKNELTGYAARSDEKGEPAVEHMRINHDELTFSMEKAIQCRSPVKVSDILQEDGLTTCLGAVSLAWLVPIYVRGRFSALLGLGVLNKDNPKFNSEDFSKILDIVAGEIALSLDNVRLFNRVKKEARVDALTGLFNRRTIMKILDAEFARYKRKPNPLTVVLFDLDNFKSINDTRGHLAGDDFLIKIAKELKGNFRESDYVGRYGGDEFIAILPDTDQKGAETVIQRICDRIRVFCSRYQGDDIPKKLSISIGFAGAETGMSKSEEIVNNADTALYEAKALGRDRYVAHTSAPVA